MGDSALAHCFGWVATFPIPPRPLSYLGVSPKCTGGPATVNAQRHGRVRGIGHYQHGYVAPSRSAGALVPVGDDGGTMATVTGDHDHLRFTAGPGSPNPLDAW